MFYPLLFPRPLPSVKILLALVAAFCVTTAFAQDAQRAPAVAPGGIRLNTVGYQPDSPKLMTIAGAPEGSVGFSVLSVEGMEPVITGLLSAPAANPSTKEILRTGDFTDLKHPGRYIVRIEGVGDSPPFDIAPHAMNESLRLLMLGFYGQRCGTAVRLEHNGVVFEHGPCHLEDGYLDYWDPARSGERRDGTGGWHDAGDHGKYSVNAAFSTAMMLWAWEQFGADLRHLALPIPEAGGPLPDYLDELKFNLDWLLKMQAPDGRISHKLTRLNFSALDTMPEEDSEPRYFTPDGTFAAASFIGVGCMAARVYGPFDPAYAQRWQEAVRKAVVALRAYGVGDKRPDLSQFHTGAYLVDPQSTLDWAAIEHWLTFGEELFNDSRFFHPLSRTLLNDNPVVDVDWDWIGARNLGIYSYLFSDHKGRDPEVLEKLRRDLLTAADTIVRNHDSHLYGRGLRASYWGINGSIARTTFNLWAAWKLTGDEKYRQVAFDQVSYLYGRNPFGRSFVTGDGFMPPMHPHHRPSVGDDVVPPWPGHLLGGPQPAEMNWYDDQADASTNENCLNWDAALVFALAWFYEPQEG